MNLNRQMNMSKLYKILIKKCISHEKQSFKYVSLLLVIFEKKLTEYDVLG